MNRSQLMLIVATVVCACLFNLGGSRHANAFQQPGGSEDIGSYVEISVDGDDADVDVVDANDELEKILEGHSYHGEAFNEGPRQKAYLMGGTGNVEFDVTTCSPEAQAFILQGVGQLHGFWDLEAERSFRQAAALDPDCAMAYWGAALATVGKLERARGFIAKAVELKEKATTREQMYIDALDKYLKEKPEKSKRAAEYIKDLESISLDFPDDLEAKALIAHRIWQNSREGVQISSYIATDALLREIFQAEPLHPSHHYTIHLWDYRKPEKALNAAARCGISAPSIAHMWHMPGHIYSRLHRYEDAVYQQEASARVDHGHMTKDRVMPDEIHNFAHNNEWLIRNLIFVGRVSDALALAENMISLPQHPKYNTLEKKSGSASFGRKRLLQVLREYQLFEETIAYCQSSLLELSDIEEEQVVRDRWLACAAVMKGQEGLVVAAKERIQALLDSNQVALDSAKSTIAEMDTLLNRHEKLPARPSMVHLDDDEAKETKSEAVKTKSRSEAMVKRCTASQKAIEGYRAFAENKYAEAHKLLGEADDEDASWLAEIQFLAGESEEAVKSINELVAKRENEVIPLARQVFLLSESGDKDAAKAAFENLRNASFSTEINRPMFARLAAIANEFGFDEHWLKPKVLAADVGFRPELDSLGPLKWAPPVAPEWQLLNPEGSMTGSSGLKGKPYVLIFYLGHGCLHCAEQLQSFGPEYEKFKQAGIEIIAISTDGDEGLKKSLSDYGANMPIPLLSDENLKVFKDFRAFDDFEQLPLHGTFLIDADNRIRWQDISYEPFMEHEFLLTESLRLLSNGGDPLQRVTRRKP